MKAIGAWSSRLMENKQTLCSITKEGLGDKEHTLTFQGTYKKVSCNELIHCGHPIRTPIFGRSWIEAARSEELQRERRRNPWVYAPNGPPSLGYASEPYEIIHQPSRHLTRWVYGVNESTLRRTQPPRTSEVSGKSFGTTRWEAGKGSRRYGEAPPLALRDELVIDKFRDQMIQDLRKRKMLPGMEKNLTELITDGLTVIPKHAKEGLGKEYRDVLISIIRDRLKIHIFHLGTNTELTYITPLLKKMVGQ